MAEETQPAQAWPAQITDKIVDVIEQVRVKTTQPAITVARGLVYGLALVLVGIVMSFVLLIGLFRLVVVALNGWPGYGVWSAYVVFGVVFVALGMALWSKRTP